MDEINWIELNWIVSTKRGLFLNFFEIYEWNFVAWKINLECIQFPWLIGLHYENLPFQAFEAEWSPTLNRIVSIVLQHEKLLSTSYDVTEAYLNKVTSLLFSSG
jgi:hypothetical protein